MRMCVQTEEWFTSTVDLTKPLGEDIEGRPRFRITYARRGSLPASKVSHGTAYFVAVVVIVVIASVGVVASRGSMLMLFVVVALVCRRL